ncbi:hypothetical protein M8494_05065 [Serratia ureilytica]
MPPHRVSRCPVIALTLLLRRRCPARTKPVRRGGSHAAVAGAGPWHDRAPTTASGYSTSRWRGRSSQASHRDRLTGFLNRAGGRR